MSRLRLPKTPPTSPLVREAPGFQKRGDTRYVIRETAAPEAPPLLRSFGPAAPHRMFPAGRERRACRRGPLRTRGRSGRRFALAAPHLGRCARPLLLAPLFSSERLRGCGRPSLRGTCIRRLAVRRPALRRSRARPLLRMRLAPIRRCFVASLMASDRLRGGGRLALRRTHIRRLALGRSAVRRCCAATLLTVRLAPIYLLRVLVVPAWRAPGSAARVRLRSKTNLPHRASRHAAGPASRRAWPRDSFPP